MTTEEREQFLAARKTGVGGSDIANLFNIEPYGCRRRLWYDKMDVPADYPVDETPAMRRGNVLEDVAAKEYEHETGNTVHKAKQVQHPSDRWAIVNIDRWVFTPADLVTSDMIAEIKCPGREVFARIKKTGMPEAYILQAQHGMFVTGARRCVFIVFCTDPWEVLYFTVERDPELIEQIRKAGSAFWQSVETKQIPDRLDPKAVQCGTCPYRTSCQGAALLEAVDKKGSKDSLPYDATLSTLVREYLDAKDLVDQAESIVKIVREPLEAALGQRSGVDTDGARIYFAVQSRKLTDTKAMAKIYEEMRAMIRAPFLTQGSEAEFEDRFPPADTLFNTSYSRPLRIYPR